MYIAVVTEFAPAKRSVFPEREARNWSERFELAGPADPTNR